MSPAVPAAVPAAARAAAPSAVGGAAPAAVPATVPGTAPATVRGAVPAAPPGPWRDSAACAGLPSAVVFARRAKDAAPALRACAACPVRRECEQAVAPAESWFDGVCGGRLWRNGRPAALTSPSRSPRA